jgi:lauroyl/myristoyl acyltransferase
MNHFIKGIGRPKTEEPRTQRIFLTFTEKEFEVINKYAEQTGQTMSKVVVRCFNAAAFASSVYAKFYDGIGEENMQKIREEISKLSHKDFTLEDMMELLNNTSELYRLREFADMWKEK